MFFTLKRKNLGTIYLIVLLSLSILLVIADQFFLEKSFVLTPESDYAIHAGDDRTVGGLSKAVYEPASDHFILHCELITSDYAWPFCSLVFDFSETALGEKRQGIDLSNYSSVVVNAQYQTEKNKKERGIRIQSRNYNPAYSKKNDFDSLKFAGLEYYPIRETSPVNIELTAFQSAQWWLNQYKLPIAFTQAEFSNVLLFEVATGGGTPVGKYTLIIDTIEFKGKYVASHHLYLLITAIWSFSGAVLLMLLLKQYAGALKHSKLKQEELESLNDLLNIQSQTLADQVVTDELTGILNRVALKAFFADEEKFAATKDNLAVIFADIDYFKQINDNYGHLVGDEVLKQFSDLLRLNVRNRDILTRWGGEEFVILCPHTELSDAERLAEKLRLLIEQALFSNDLKITSSFGVAHLAGGESPTEFLNKADSALYYAKNKGRNCVSCA